MCEPFLQAFRDKLAGEQDIVPLSVLQEHAMLCSARSAQRLCGANFNHSAKVRNNSLIYGHRQQDLWAGQRKQDTLLRFPPPVAVQLKPS